MNTFTATLEVPDEIVSEARQRKSASGSDADLDEFIVDHLKLELDY